MSYPLDEVLSLLGGGGGSIATDDPSDPDHRWWRPYPARLTGVVRAGEPGVVTERAVPPPPPPGAPPGAQPDPAPNHAVVTMLLRPSVPAGGGVTVAWEGGEARGVTVTSVASVSQDSASGGYAVTLDGGTGSPLPGVGTAVLLDPHWSYTSEEVILASATGDYSTPSGSGPRSTSEASAPLREMNERLVNVAARPVVRVWFRGMVNGRTCWEFDGAGAQAASAPPGTVPGGPDLDTSPPTGTGSGGAEPVPYPGVGTVPNYVPSLGQANVWAEQQTFLQGVALADPSGRGKAQIVLLTPLEPGAVRTVGVQVPADPSAPPPTLNLQTSVAALPSPDGSPAKVVGTAATANAPYYVTVSGGSTTNDLAVPEGVSEVVVTNTGASTATLTGFSVAGASPGKPLRITNSASSSGSVSISNEGAGSTPAGRVKTSSGSDRTLTAGQAADLVYDGSVVITSGSPAVPRWREPSVVTYGTSGAATGAGTLVASSVGFSGQTAVAFTGLTGYKFYKIVGYDLQSSSAMGATLQMRTSTDGGSSYDSGASDYKQNAGTATTQINVGTMRADSGSDAAFFELTLFNPAGTVTKKAMIWHLADTGAGGAGSTVPNYGYRDSTADVDAVQFTPSTGTFKGSLLVYGYN